MSIQTEYLKKYAQWKWDAWVIRNEWLTSAIIPQAGGRILQYNLGDHPLLQGHPNRPYLKNSIEQDATCNAFCGHQVAPIGNSSPPWEEMSSIHSGMYGCEMEAHEDRIRLKLLSLKDENESGIQLEKQVVFHANNTRCEIDLTLINHGGATKELAFRNLFPHPVIGLADADRFQITFPTSRKSRFGVMAVQTNADIPAWRGSIAPNIYSVHFQPADGRMIADSREGWVAYWDKKQGVSLTRMFTVFQGRTYPDDGATLAVRLTQEPLSLFSEIFGPVRSVPGNGGRLSFSESWGAAAISGPVIGVSETGAIAQRLSTRDNRITGSYGVFYQGSAHLVYRDLRGVMLKRSVPRVVSPTQAFVLNEPDGMTPDVKLIELQVNSEAGIEIGVLDSLEV